MGSIVSDRRQSVSGEIYPSEAMAVQVKLRQAAIDAQPSLVRKLLRSKAYEGCAGHDIPEWYPAGISPWYMDDNGVMVYRKVSEGASNSEWMDHMMITRKELLRSAILIQKTFRGHSSRRSLQEDHKCARKIQRRYRHWKRTQDLSTDASTPLLHLHSAQSPNSGTRRLSTGIFTLATSHSGAKPSENDDEFKFVRSGQLNQVKRRRSRAPTKGLLVHTWNKDSSFPNGVEGSVIGTGYDKPAVHGVGSESSSPHLNAGNTHHAGIPLTSMALADLVNQHNAMMAQKQPLPSVQPLLISRVQPLSEDSQTLTSIQSQIPNDGGQHTEKEKAPNNTDSTPLDFPIHVHISSRQSTRMSSLTKHYQRSDSSEGGSRTNSPGASNHSAMLGEPLSSNIDIRDANIRMSNGDVHMNPPSQALKNSFKQAEVNSQADKNGLDINCTDGNGHGVSKMKSNKADEKWSTSTERRPSPPNKYMNNTEESCSRQKVKRSLLSYLSLEDKAEEQTEPLCDPATVSQQICAHPSESSASGTCITPQRRGSCPISKVDSMIRLLYQEVGVSEASYSIPDGTVTQEGSHDNTEITPQLVHTTHTAEQNQWAKTVKSSDVKKLLKAAEFKPDVSKKLKHLTTAIRLEYYQFMEDVDQTKFCAAQQLESFLPDYTPQLVVLISSKVPKCEALISAVQPGVLAHIYDFHSDLDVVLDSLKTLLDGVQPGAKAKNLAIVCKGGPGFFYLVEKVPVTPVKLRANETLLRFWRDLGKHMSKLHPGQSTVHLMESNMAGNRQGESLLVDLEAALHPHQVKVKCPLELAPSGRNMIKLYFDANKYKLWKMTRYTKLDLFKK